MKTKVCSALAVPVSFEEEFKLSQPVRGFTRMILEDSNPNYVISVVITSNNVVTDKWLLQFINITEVNEAYVEVAMIFNNMKSFVPVNISDCCSSDHVSFTLYDNVKKRSILRTYHFRSSAICLLHDNLHVIMNKILGRSN